MADRGNARIQVFDSDGKLLRQIKINVPYDHSLHPWLGNMPGAGGGGIPGQASSANAEVQAPVNGTMSNGAPWAICITPGPNQVLFAADAYPGRIYKLSLDGKVLGVIGHSGHLAGEFGWIHELACPSENEVYAAELLNWRVQKLILEPTPAAK